MNQMSNNPDSIVLMMTIDNVQGREILNKLLDYKIPIKSIIVEHKSKLAENIKNYLNTEIYRPKSFKQIIENTGIPVHYVENLNNDSSLNLLNNKGRSVTRCPSLTLYLLLLLS